MHSSRRSLPFIIIGILVLLELYAFSGITILNEEQSDVVQIVVAIFFYGLMGVSFVGLGIIFSFGNRLNKVIRNFLFAFVFINLFSVLIFDLFLVLDDLQRFVRGIFGFGSFQRIPGLLMVGAALSILPAVLFLLGMIIGPYRYRIHEVVVPIRHLPKAFQDFKIVQLSDIHAGSFYNPRAVQRGVDLVKKQNADVIFFTGDLVNDDANEMNDYKNIFAQLSAPNGVFSILGNHDYGDYVQWPSQQAKANNLNKLKQVHADMGWRLLLDEHVYLENDNAKIGLIGVENWGKGFKKVGDLEKALKGLKADVKILLSHDPTHWEEEVIKQYPQIDLTLSGHTHGAQMGFEIGKFRWSPIKLRYKKWAGLYQEGKQFLYINRGFGFLGYPGRLGIWPEITVLRLKESELNHK